MNGLQFAKVWPNENVCEWSNGEGIEGFCLEVNNPKLADKVNTFMGKVVVFSTIKGKIWADGVRHEALIDLREAKEEDYEKYPSMLDSE